MIKKVYKNTLCRIVLPSIYMMAFTAVKAQGRLDDYIRQGLASNESIRQQNFVLEKNINALKEAKSKFLPEVTFLTNYTKAQGGRTIDFPAGDLLNGAYSTLNQLTGSNAFPQLQNQKVLINPDNFYDARFHTTQPIVNAELIYNKRIKSQQVDLQKEEVLLYKRELVKEIKTAYYNYLKAFNAVKIYQSFQALVEEGERVNTKLYDNNKINRTAVIRSRNEVSGITAALVAARKKEEASKYYFNFLINRPLTDSIVTEEIVQLPSPELPERNEVNRREELSKLRISKEINRNITGLSKSYIIPKIGAFVDLGSQAFNWKFNNDSRYYFMGVSLEWSLLSFGKNNYRVKQTISEKQAIESQTAYVQQQLLTELKVRQTDMQSAIAQYQSAQSQLKTSETYYNDMAKLYKEGLAIYRELLDAQNQWVNAQLNANIALFDTWISFTAIERANASYNIQ